MEGYDVVTIDDEKVGTVVGESGDYLLVEHGLLRKSKHALPREFAHVNDGEREVRITVGKEVFLDLAGLDGDIDEQAVGEYYGLAPSGRARHRRLRSDRPRGPARSSEEQALRDGVSQAQAERAQIREPDSEIEELPRCWVTAPQASRTTRARRSLNRLCRAKAPARHRGEKVVPRRPLVVPGQCDLSHQCRVRLLQAGVVAERPGRGGRRNARNGSRSRAASRSGPPCL